MPINRAPFNALVDDDGSNTIGTPWNKAAIAGVILDPVDAALLAGLPLLHSGGGSTSSLAGENLDFAPVPQLGGRDTVLVRVNAADYVASGPAIMMDLVIVPAGTTFVDGVVLTGAAGAGDLVPGSIATWSVTVRPAPIGGNTESLGLGATTAGITQIRGFTFARVCVADLTAQGNNLIGLRQYGVGGSGFLHWAWSVHLLKG